MKAPSLIAAPLFVSVWACCLVIAFTPLVSAQDGAVTANDRPQASDRPQDRQAIEAAAQAFAQSFGSGNAAAVAALFTEDAEYRDDAGEVLHGRDALAKAYSGLFEKIKNAEAESKTNEIRFLGRDTAVEEGTFTVKGKDRPANASRYSSLYVRQDGKWLIAMLKEWGDDETDAPSLDDLAWLIGTWESASDNGTARTTYAWTPNKSFIRADYVITPKGEDEKPSAGTQVIGVDPAVGLIRGWLFASDGGIGESNWSWDGERWMIESIGTMVDGTPTTAVNFLTKTDDDTFTWRSVGRTLAGESEADAPPVTVNRVADAAKVSATAPKTKAAAAK